MRYFNLKHLQRRAIMNCEKSICRKQGKLALILSLLMVFGFLGMVGGVMPAAAFNEVDIQCGDIIGPHERVRLTQDIGPCAEFDGPVLTVVGPAVLDLNGHTVACQDESQDGILLEGERARLVNGTVTGCENGVVVDGAGRHKIYRINAELNPGEAFLVYSDNNSFRWNTADENQDSGFDVQGHGNKFLFNKISSNWEGFWVKGEGNKIILNRLVENQGEGIEIVEGANESVVVMNRGTGNNKEAYRINSNDNNLSFNIAEDGFNDGFQIDGDRNRLRYNCAKGNEDSGFRLRGDENRLSRNHARGNTQDGFEVEGNYNNLHRNFAKDNTGSGIVAEESKAENNIITRNIAQNNGISYDNEYDLADENGAEVNTWRRNRFGTSNEDYIQ